MAGKGMWRKLGVDKPAGSALASNALLHRAAQSYAAVVGDGGTHEAGQMAAKTAARAMGAGGRDAAMGKAAHTKLATKAPRDHLTSGRPMPNNDGVSNEVFRKTTGKGAVLVVTHDGQRLAATVDGKEIDATLRTLDKPRDVGGKTVVAQMGPIGLTRADYDAIQLGWRGAPPPAVDAKYEHAKGYSAEERAWDRGFERKVRGE